MASAMLTSPLRKLSCAAGAVVYVNNTASSSFFEVFFADDVI